MEVLELAGHQARKHGAIPESNIGYKMLKAAGWKEDRGLGVQEQGRLRPIETRVPKGREGIGSRLSDTDGGPQKGKRKKSRKEDDEQEKAKPLTKNARKRLREAEEARNQAIARELYRDFMPDNV